MLRPSRFASNTAASAVPISASSSDASSGAVATPMLAVRYTGFPATQNGAANAARRGGGRRARRARHVFAAQQHELVAAEARDVRLRQRLAQPRSDLAQHGVAGGVIAQLVDHAKAIDVEEQHGERVAVAFAVGERAARMALEGGDVAAGP